jgi:1,4-alpha-glucan branching enzyme
MPVAQFAGQRNWGYDGVFPFSAQHSYGGTSGLKRLGNACHREKLGVALDVVYNDLGPEGNNLECLPHAPEHSIVIEPFSFALYHSDDRGTT